MWKKLNTKLLLDHPRIKVYEDTVALPDGHTTDYLRYAAGGDGITIIAKNAEGKILLSREYSYPVDRIIWQFPGGGINPSESPEQAAVRELREEAKLLPQKVRLLGSYLANNRRSDNRVYACIAEHLVSAPLEADQEEAIKNFWLDEAEIEELIRKGKIEQAHVLAAWSLYKLNI